MYSERCLTFVSEIILLLCFPLLTTQCPENYIHGIHFNGTIFQKISRSRLFSCAADCVSYSVCKSVSFDRREMVCFLHLEDGSGQPDNLHNAPDFSYSVIQDWSNVVLGPCQTYPCMINQRCVVKRNRRRCIDMTTNLSLGKATKSSSSYNGDDSSVVDGNRDPIWAQSRSCFHVDNNDPAGWWQVDLGTNVLVIDVLITNRGDCCEQRLRNFHLETFTEDPSEDPTAKALVCYRHPNEVLAAGATVTFNCTTPVIGRYFRVSIPNPIDNENFVQLCEVEVNGWPID